MSDQKTRATRSRISRLCSLAFDRPSLLDRVRRDLGTVFCIAGSKSVAADQNRAITFRPVRPRCKLWLDRVRRGNTVSSGFEREYLLRILPSILGNAVATPNPPSYLSIRSPFPSVPRNAYSETDHFPRLSRPLFSTISRTMVFFTLEQKKGKNSDRGGSSLGGEKEGRERDISCEGITVEFRLISMEAFSFSSDRLARRIVERTDERKGGGTKDKELEGDEEEEEDKDKEVHS